MQARFFTTREDKKVQCELCPNNCLISPGKTGICKVRLNKEGTLVLPYYGKLSAVALDPIEKKPLYHFYPGTSILSIGFVGCSFHCPFCQNYHISQSTQAATEYISPVDLVDLAMRKDSLAIAYTYSEPLIHLEYVLDAAKLAKGKGIKNVLVSNGFINPGPAEELLEVLDAANIDLKCYTDEFYRKEIGGRLEAVKRFIKQAAGKIELEVTTLVIPGKNDRREEIAEIARFLSGLDPAIPYHLSCYYPTYKYAIPGTQPQTVIELAEHAKKYLKYVYVGNVGLYSTGTVCPSCGNILIERRGYSVAFPGVENGSCRQCGEKIAIPGLP
ncbi:MAG: AmmeMemoRadiSam system radical SAM enzyme [Spirochaetales bacterium]|nr:AmmeMemoRadiSam system radical SAM enzyme [Spirochaetales bacterium]